MIRSSMLDLIERVRALIYDADGEVFEDADIEGVLDQRRVEWRYAALNEKATVAPGGTVSYLDFWSPVGNWEGNATLVDSGYNSLTPSAMNYQTGEFSFASAPDLPVMISGYTYDIYGTAADMLEEWAAKVALEFDFSAGGQSFQRSQKHAALLRLAQVYRAQQTTRLVGKLLREDTN